jgi:hypothetical protein
MDCIETENIMNALECSYSYVQQQVQSEYLNAENVGQESDQAYNDNHDFSLKGLSGKTKLLPKRALPTVNKARATSTGSVTPTIQEHDVWLEFDSDNKPRDNLHFQSIFNSTSD